MDILETLDHWDKQLLLWINHDGGPVADAFWHSASSKVAWVATVLVILYFLARNRRGWRSAVLVILTTILVATLCDQAAASMIKPIAMRPRPSHDEELSSLLHYVNNYHGGRFGFVSNHAANAFGMVTWLALLLRGHWFHSTIFIWATGNCYSRLYLGVHYPGDVLCGALLGATIALIMWRLYKRLERKVVGTDTALLAVEPYRREPWIIMVTIWATFAVLGVLAVIKSGRTVL